MDGRVKACHDAVVGATLLAPSFEMHRGSDASRNEDTTPHLSFIASLTVSPTNAAAREKASSLSPRKLTVRVKISFSF